MRCEHTNLTKTLRNIVGYTFSPFGINQNKSVFKRCKKFHLFILHYILKSINVSFLFFKARDVSLLKIRDRVFSKCQSRRLDATIWRQQTNQLTIPTSLTQPSFLMKFTFVVLRFFFYFVLKINTKRGREFSNKINVDGWGTTVGVKKIIYWRWK